MKTPDDTTPAWHAPAGKLIQWRHRLSHNDSYVGEPAGLFKQLAAEFERLLPPNEQAIATGRELLRAAGADDGCGACGDACKSRGGACQLAEDSPPIGGGAQDAAAINAQLLEELRNMVETFRPNASGSDGNRTDALNDAERAIAAAEAQGGSAAQPWIPVGERLPEDRSHVVFHSDDLRNPTRMLLGLYVDGRWMSCGYEMVNVTHWMPAPDTPVAAEGK